MSIFDKLNHEPSQTAGAGPQTFVFPALPESLPQMQKMEQAGLATPFETAALTVCALCAYAAKKQNGLEMLNWLRGPRPLNGQDLSFLEDRFRGGKHYVPFSYFAGAVPGNGYTPDRPYTLTIFSDAASTVEQGYCKLFIPCGGADRPRPIKLRQRGSDGKWFLWEQALLTGIRQPEQEDPWA